MFRLSTAGSSTYWSHSNNISVCCLQHYSFLYSLFPYQSSCCSPTSNELGIHLFLIETNNKTLLWMRAQGKMQLQPFPMWNAIFFPHTVFCILTITDTNCIHSQFYQQDSMSCDNRQKWRQQYKHGKAESFPHSAFLLCWKWSARNVFTLKHLTFVVLTNLNLCNYISAIMMSLLLRSTQQPWGLHPPTATGPEGIQLRQLPSQATRLILPFVNLFNSPLKTNNLFGFYFTYLEL